MSSGKEFQTVGPATANARRPWVLSRCRGTETLWRKNDHIYSSAARKKNINARSLIMRARTFQPQCYVPVAVLRVGYAEVVFIQPGGKLDTVW